jgi:hypothetical protein
VAIPESRGQHVRWDNFLTVAPHPEGLAPFLLVNGVYTHKIQIPVVISLVQLKEQELQS